MKPLNEVILEVFHTLDADSKLHSLLLFAAGDKKVFGYKPDEKTISIEIKPVEERY
jgi:hypothetical protein